MRKELLFSIVLILTIGFAIAEESGGILTGKQNAVINLPQECADCTYVKLTTITLPDLTQISIQTNMIQDGTSYYYSFNRTAQIGEYQYCTLGDVGGTDTIACKDFEITPSGFSGTLGFYIVLLCIIAGIVIMGFAIKEEWFVVLGGLGFIMLGIYSINYGVVGFRDMFMTWGVGLFEIAVGTILSVGAAWQKVESD
jgi:hypothetical protein